MRCEAVQALLDRYLEDQLTQVQRDRIDEHLKDCAHCARTLGAARGFVRLLEDCLGWLQAPESHLESIYFNVSQAGRSRRGTHSSEVVSRAGKSSTGIRWTPVVAVLALVVALGAVGFVVFFRDGGGAELARVLEKRGLVIARFASGDGNWIPVEEGTTLGPGDRISVEAGNQGRIELADRSGLELIGGTKGSEGEIQSAKGGADFLLLRGTVHCVLSPTPTPFKLLTDLASVDVDRSGGRDARFEVELAGTEEAPTSLVVRVDKGMVEVRNGQGVSRVGEGKTSRTSRGGKPGPGEESRPKKTERSPVAQRDRRNSGTQKAGDRGSATRRSGSAAPGEDASRDRKAASSPRAPKVSQADFIRQIEDGSDPNKQLAALNQASSRLRQGDSEPIKSALLGVLRASPEENVRRACIGILITALQSGEDELVLQGLVDASRGDSGPTVRIAALQGLSGLISPEKLSELLAGVFRNESDDLVLEGAARLAARSPTPEVSRGLVDLARDGSRGSSLRAEAIKGLSSHRNPAAVEGLMELAGGYEIEIAVEAVGALRVLSGQTFVLEANSTPEAKDETLRAIQEWWDQARPSFEEGSGG